MPSESFLKQYVKDLQKELTTGHATEHTHRPALKKLIESLDTSITATNEPKRTNCGAPDYVISKKRGLLTIGHIEAKDIGKSLDEEERSEQLSRYFHSLDNIILTDYLEFRWYVKGEFRKSAQIARLLRRNKLVKEKDGEKAVIELIKNFTAHSPETISSPKELADKMARLTHMIQEIIIKAFDNKNASDLLMDLREAFAKTLLPDIDQPDKISEFADMYAQTIAYGLFAACCNHPKGTPFQRLGAAAEIPKTNPFLRKLFDSITGAEFNDEPYINFVDDIAQVLATADFDKILAHFGKRTGRQDPVVHFYETFLASYDAKLREVRGVYYTPEPVVSYIVRSVDSILRKQFGLAEGLADTSTIDYEIQKSRKEKIKKTSPRLLILDPACGTKTFLYSVIDHIRQDFMDRGNAGMWADYVKEHLLPRLYGFELLMAPYAIAHLKLGMQLSAYDLEESQRQDWTCDLSGNGRLGVYLTNTLEEIDRQVKISLYGPLKVIAEEATAAYEIKHDLPIMVIIGNPPYSGQSANRSWVFTKDKNEKIKRIPTFIGTLIKEYYKVDGKKLEERNPKWLQDDYVKFIRWAQWRIDRTGAGVLAFISNHGYLDNPTFRGMRQSLMNSFNDIYILDLHGNTHKKERCPDGSEDKNIFDILQGVAIGIFIKKPGKKSISKIHHADLWGLRSHKYDRLSDDDIDKTCWQTIKPTSPFYMFIPQDTTLEKEYNKGWGIKDIMPFSSVGIATARDKFTIHWEKNDVWNTVEDFYPLPEEVAREKYSLGEDVQDWTVCSAQDDLRLSGPKRNKIVEILYRPFDIRYTYYTGKSKGFHCRPRPASMNHMLSGKNIALKTSRLTKGETFKHAQVTRNIVEVICMSPKTSNNGFVFPLYLYEEVDGRGARQTTLDSVGSGKDGRVPNINPAFVKEVTKKLKMKFISDKAGDLIKTFGPEDIMNYVYAIFYSKNYRERYVDFLRRDFPRIPLTDDKKIFRKLSELGKQLVALHLMDSLPKTKLKISYPITGNNDVEKGYPKFDDLKNRVYINEAQFFDGIPEAVWDFEVGGYPVCEKWLKDRRGRILTYSDRVRYQNIVNVLNKTIELMAKIDNIIPSWPLK